MLSATDSLEKTYILEIVVHWAVSPDPIAANPPAISVHVVQHGWLLCPIQFFGIRENEIVWNWPIDIHRANHSIRNTKQEEGYIRLSSNNMALKLRLKFRLSSSLTCSGVPNTVQILNSWSTSLLPGNNGRNVYNSASIQPMAHKSMLLPYRVECNRTCM